MNDPKKQITQKERPVTNPNTLNTKIFVVNVPTERCHPIVTLGISVKHSNLTSAKNRKVVEVFYTL